MGIPESEITELSKQFCDMMRYEFILCKPCQRLDDVIRDTIADLQMKGTILRPEVKSRCLSKPS